MKYIKCNFNNIKLYNIKTGLWKTCCIISSTQREVLGYLNDKTAHTTTSSNTKNAHNKKTLHWNKKQTVDVYFILMVIVIDQIIPCACVGAD